MKTVALMSRKPGMTRADFRDYYETRHTVLGMRYFRFEKYIRNHVVEPDEGPFDVFSEFWQGSLPEVYATMAGPIGEIMREDGSRFIDRSRHRLANAEERLIAGLPRGVDPTPTVKTCLFLTSAGGTDFLDDAVRWGGQIAAARSVIRVMLDRIAPFENAPFPYEAILSIWHAPGAAAVHPVPPPEGIVVGAAATLESCETPPAVLAAAYDKDAVAAAI